MARASVGQRRRITVAHHRAWVLLAVITASCAATTGGIVDAARGPSDWAAVTALKPDSKIKVETPQGWCAGRLVSADANGVTVSIRDVATPIGRPQIRQLVVQRRQAGRKARIGFGIGAFIGGATAAITTDSFEWMSLMAVEWGALGALFGALDGAGDIRDVLVYDARGHPPYR